VALGPNGYAPLELLIKSARIGPELLARSVAEVPIARVQAPARFAGAPRSLALGAQALIAGEA
jgi:hypothetical protein